MLSVRFTRIMRTVELPVARPSKMSMGTLTNAPARPTTEFTVAGTDPSGAVGTADVDRDVRVRPIDASSGAADAGKMQRGSVEKDARDDGREEAERHWTAASPGFTPSGITTRRFTGSAVRSGEGDGADAAASIVRVTGTRALLSSPAPSTARTKKVTVVRLLTGSEDVKRIGGAATRRAKDFSSKTNKALAAGGERPPARGPCPPTCPRRRR